MIRLPPRSTRTDTLFPYTTLFRSYCAASLIPHNVRKTLSDCKCVRQHGFGGFPSCSLATCAYRQPMIGTQSIGSVAKIGGSQRSAVALRRSGGCCEMVVRAEERRGGTECVSTCRSGWASGI